MNILFLDFDGVTHTNDDLKENLSFRKDNMDRLEKLCEEFELKIVISSSWRLFQSKEDIVCQINHSIGKRVYDMTGEDMDNRADEVELWLRHNACDLFIIIDDYDWGLSKKFSQNLILTNPDIGFCESSLKKSIHCLKAQRSNINLSASALDFGS